MNYTINSKNRKLKNKIHTVLNRLSFNFLHLTLSQKIVCVGIVISFAALFINWFTIQYEKTIDNNAFSLNVGYLGYVVSLLLVILVFILLSNNSKEKVKSKTNIMFSDHTIIIFFGLIILLLTFVVSNASRGFIVFFQNVAIGNGMVFEFIGSIFIITGGIIHYREQKRELLNTIYVENSQTKASILEEYEDILHKNTKDKKNMSLPI